MAIVLVDADGDTDRETMVRGHLDTLPTATTADCLVVAVAVQEFEAWLLADLEAVRATLSLRIDHIDPPESMPRGEAKRRLGALIAEAGQSSRDARLSIARMCNLGVLRDRCPAFDRFAEQLRVS